MTVEAETIAERLKRLRAEAGLSQAALAASAGVSTSAIGNIESGLRTYGSSIVPIARALQVSASYLGCDTDVRGHAEPGLNPTLGQALAIVDGAVQRADRDTRDQVQKVFGLYLSNPRRFSRLLKDVEELLEAEPRVPADEFATVPEISAEDVAWARAFALKRHATQSYGAPPFPVQPYSYHLEAVASIARPYGAFAELLAWLHDVKEDGHAVLPEVVTRFGSLAGDGVELLSDLPGATRKERKAATYARLATVAGPLVAALIAKVADRLGNVRQCIADGNHRLLNMYRSEHAAFRAAAYRPGLCDELWAELDALLLSPKDAEARREGSPA